MVAPQSTLDFGPTLLPDLFGRAGFDRPYQSCERDLGRVGDEQVCVVLVGVELVEGCFVASTDLGGGLAEQPGDASRHDLATVLRGQDDVGVQSVDHVSSGAPFVRCGCHHDIVDHVSHRYRMTPTPDEAAKMADWCAHARYVWNLALEQRNFWRRGMPPLSGYDQIAQLKEARSTSEWLRSGPSAVQQRAVLDLDRAFKNWWNNPGHFGRPKWRKAGLDEGFTIRDVKVQRLSRRWAQVMVPKLGPVRFKLHRPMPAKCGMGRVTFDRAGRWHVSFAAIPDQIEGPGTGVVVGIDRGVAISFQCSDGRAWQTPTLTSGETRRLRLLQRKLARQQKGSNRRGRTKLAIARLEARAADRRKDMVEKVTTELARSADMVRIEDLKVSQMMASASGTIDEPGRNVAQKRGLNRSIAQQGWALFGRRLQDKIGGRLEKVPAAYTSQRCSQCGEVDLNSRKNQAEFRCTTCVWHSNADVNAALNIAAGHAVSGRGRKPQSRAPDETSTSRAVGEICVA